jgi:CRISPR-associated endonuclease/helicase Cas3
VALHHSRFAVDDRRLLDKEVETCLGKERDPGGIVVVGTQTLEQSLDIDADLLITDLCPVDVLLQRIGRLHRHRRTGRPGGYDAPRCIVLTPGSEDLSPLLQGGSNRTGLGPHGFVYKDLRVLEATRRLIAEFPEWSIPDMNRQLVERATHPAELEAIVQEMGDDWRVHANEVLGGELGDGLTAANAIIPRNKSFFTDNREVLFGSDEEKIRTRLGDEGIEVDFDPPPPSPFEPSRNIERMTVLEHLLRGATAAGPVTPSLVEGGFTFNVGDRHFRYDRLGLRQER